MDQTNNAREPRQMPHFTADALAALASTARGTCDGSTKPDPFKGAFPAEALADFKAAYAFGESETPPPGSNISPKMWASLKASGIRPTPQLDADLASMTEAVMVADKAAKVDPLASLNDPATAAKLLAGVATPRRRPIPSVEVTPPAAQPLVLLTRAEYAHFVSLLEAWRSLRDEHVAALDANTRAMNELAAQYRRHRDAGDEWKGGPDDPEPGDDGGE